MVFLGTPHRGSDLAKVLNRLLAVPLIGPSPKQYIADLAENSPTIEDLDEQFRNFLWKLRIASFYETRYTTIGHKKLVSIFDVYTVARVDFVVDSRKEEIFCSWLP
jgi:hypothetical protein